LEGTKKASEFARHKAAQLWCKFETEKIVMVPEVAEAMANLIDEYRDALIWCSGSSDFGAGGKARKGWLKICQPLIQEKRKKNG